ncbi:hypothetical protein ISCGN_022456 [Ixodes scapularis]
MKNFLGATSAIQVKLSCLDEIVYRVEALEDVRSQASSLRNTRLMVSFTLSILKYTPTDSICLKFGPISWPVWDDNIHHFGVLDFNPPYDVVHATEIIQILKLKQLELKRSSNIETYTFLAVILPLPQPDFGILKRAVGLGDIDFLIAKTHTDKGGTNTHDCEGMGPNVYNVSLAKGQVSMVEALEDVRSQASSLRNTRLMVSFTLSILKYTPTDSICLKFGPISWLCDAQLVNQTAPRLLTTHMFKTLFNFAFDDSVTINWKICNSMRRFPSLNFGVALYNLEDDDASMTSCLNASTESRLPAVSNYFRKFASKPEFGTTKNVDCGDLLSNVGTDG